MKFLKVVGKFSLGLVVLVVLLYSIGVAINWRDQPPSATAREMRKLLDDRAPVADADNGYVYVLGFSAPESSDPQAMGSIRKPWMEAVNLDPTKLRGDPMKESIGFSGAMSKSMSGVRNGCGETNFVGCRDAFLAATREPRSKLEVLQLARYRTLIGKPAWREVLTREASAPLPAYADIMQGQRLLFVDLAARAGSAPPGEIASALRQDLAFWRTALASSDILISRMISVAAIRQHFLFGNLVLREAPKAQNEVIEAWSVPFSAAELSMRRTMAGELAFTEGVLLSYRRAADDGLIEPFGEELTWLGRIGSSLARPYYQHQDSMNYYSAAYLDVAKRFEVPLDRYEEIVQASRMEAPTDPDFHVYNAVGHILQGLSNISAYTGYAVRTGSVEGMRRAALLTAQLRARGVPGEKVAAELAASELKDPFRLVPFDWDDVDKAVVYTGPKAETSRASHHYLY